MRRVAILGGGMSSLTAAYQLTRPELAGAFEVTVYQQGWRLGGKGASGRNRRHHQRIQEHGLHVWMGFYENAFRLIRDCYAELGRPAGAPLATWQDAFKPHSYIVLDDEGTPWPLCFPIESDDGQTPGDGRPIPGPPEYVPRILELVLMLLERHAHTTPLVKEAHEHLSIVTTLDEMFVHFERLLVVPIADGLEAILAQLITAAFKLAQHIAGALPEELDGLYKKILALVERAAAPLLRHFDTPELRHARLLLDFAFTHLRGFIEDKLLLPPYDFSKIDHLDYRAWLLSHGAREDTAKSAPVTALYDLVFAIDEGMAAGATLSCATRMLLTYKGALFYKMQAGMGDTVFTPLYEVLKRRGVKFEFFHRVDELRLADGPGGADCVLDEIVVGRQASTKNDAAYDPFVMVDGLACWPSDPNYDQLVEGDALAAGDELPDGGFDLESPSTKWQDPLGPVTLRRGRDFDDVVLGISIGGLPRISQALMQRLPRYKQMIDGVKTIATQAMQLWFDTDLAGLGWNDPADAQCAGAAPIGGAYAESMDTWADMTHLVPREAWGDGRIKQLAYFCGQLRDAEIPTPAPTTAAGWKRAVTDGARRWMSANGHAFWPRFAPKGGALDDSLLHSETDAAGAARWAEQYFRANTEGSERYVLTVPGSSVYRLYADDLAQDERGCRNLFLAGDWVRTGINGGCIEAAAMAGLQAARALSGIDCEIVGDPAPFRARPSVQSAFIERGGDVVYAEPYLQTRTRLFAFLVPVDRPRIAALCNRYLNWTGQFVFEPIVGHVALVFADIESTFSTDPSYIGRGTMSERDVSFWVPVRSPTAGAPPLSWFLPYIWVDNGIAMAAGREVYGFPKEVGDLVIPAAGATPARFAVDTDVIPRFGVPPDVGPDGPRAVRRNVVTVVPSAGGAPPPLAGTVGEMLRHLLKVVLSDRAEDAAINWLLGALHASVPMLFLKQFRDVGDGRRACYKALVKATSVPQNVRGGGILPGTFDVTIRGYASHPIVRDLGLGDDPGEATMRGCTGFFVDFDFLMERGVELFRAP